MEQDKQEEIWNAISQPWKNFRVKPIPEIVEFLKDKKGKILDLGCGSGRNFVRTNGIIYGVDFSENMLRFAREHAEKNKFKVELVKAEAFDLPFDDNFFDSAIFVAVLHCIPEAEKRATALMELLRVLKPGAEAWISVWDKNQARFKNRKKESFIPWKYDGKEHMRYYYLYDKKELANLLKKVGFEIPKINDSDNLDGFYSKRNIDAKVKKPN